ncbi:lytic transglycosylase domain-containing protein [Sphingomonas sp. UYAg733]
MVMLLAAALSVASATVAPDKVTRWRPYSEQASGRCGMPVLWIERVIRAESAGLTTLGGRPITSRAGAIGLMQLMPTTWAAMRNRFTLGPDPHDPRDNILAGSCYLRLMYDRFGYPGLFAAYNAGPARYADHLATGRALPGETRAYLAALVGGETGPAKSPNTPPPSTIFYVLMARSAKNEPSAPAAANGLFVALGSDMSRH